MRASRRAPETSVTARHGSSAPELSPVTTRQVLIGRNTYIPAAVTPAHVKHDSDPHSTPSPLVSPSLSSSLPYLTPSPSFASLLSSFLSRFPRFLSISFVFSLLLDPLSLFLPLPSSFSPSTPLSPYLTPPLHPPLPSSFHFLSRLPPAPSLSLLSLPLSFLVKLTSPLPRLLPLIYSFLLLRPV